MDLNNLELQFKESNNYKKIFYVNNYSKKEFQRLEFLGDRVVAIVLASELYTRYPYYNEGKLATIFSLLTSTKALSKVAKELRLDYFLLNKKNNNLSDKVLADFVEAILGSLFLDSGFKKAKKVIIELWNNQLKVSKKFKKDEKSILQEWTQSKGLGLPIYKVIEKKGSDHNPIFEVELIIKRFGKIIGKGKSLQIAQKNTAKEFIKKFLKDNIIAK